MKTKYQIGTRVIRSTLGMWLAGAFALSAATLPLFDVNFSDGTPGAPVPTSPPVAGGVSTNATGLSAAGGGTSVLIQNTWTNYTGTYVFGNGNVAVLNDPASATYGTRLEFYGAEADKATNGQVLVGFDMMLDNTPSQNGNFFIILRSTNSAAAGAIGVLGLSLGSGAGGLQVYSAGGTYGGQVAVPALTLGTNHHVAFRLNFGTGLYDLFYDGSVVATTNFAYQLGFRGIDFSTAATATGIVALDNLQTMALVPEPATGMMLVIGAGCIWLHRRRRPFAC